MHSASLAAQTRRLTELIENDLDEQAQIDCLRQLTLETVSKDILEHAVMALRQRMVPVPLTRPAVDLCGTGGDKSGSFNISTTAALVVAGAGYPVAKHGNISITSKSGSIDLLRALGVPLPELPQQATEQLERAGITFLFAPYYHPTFRKFAPARKTLAAEGTRTIFNLLGPLLNPAGVKRAVIGVFDADFTRPVAEALSCTGAEKALIFHGNGMDELSLTGRNVVYEIRRGNVTAFEWLPEFFCLPSCGQNELSGGTPEENAAMTLAILENKLHGAKKNMVLLNAGAAIYAASDDDALTLHDGIALARENLEDGHAMAVLERLRA